MTGQPCESNWRLLSLVAVVARDADKAIQFQRLNPETSLREVDIRFELVAMDRAERHCPNRDGRHIVARERAWFSYEPAALKDAHWNDNFILWNADIDIADNPNGKAVEIGEPDREDEVTVRLDLSNL